MDAPEDIDIKHLLPIIDSVPRGAFVCDTRVVHEHRNLDDHRVRYGGGWEERMSYMTPIRGWRMKEGNELRVGAFILTSPQASYTLSRNLTTCCKSLTSVGMTSTFASPTIPTNSLPRAVNFSVLTSAMATFKRKLKSRRKKKIPSIEICLNLASKDYTLRILSQLLCQYRKLHR
jgi:hypothetical protein